MKVFVVTWSVPKFTETGLYIAHSFDALLPIVAAQHVERGWTVDRVRQLIGSGDVVVWQESDYEGEDRCLLRLWEAKE